MVDGHVHIYDCYDLERFFKVASAYLDHFYNTLYANGAPFEKLLLLTEGKQNDFFGQWKLKKEFPNTSGFHFHETGEAVSMLLTRDDKPVCYVIKGRQIVTRENLEVLALGSAQLLEDGLPIETVLNRLIEREEIAVLAWGMGKWLGKRGDIIKRIIRQYSSPYLLVGDNSGRPLFWPTPQLFKTAAQAGIALINGSDPLPFPEEVNKPGSFGFSLMGEFTPQQPAACLRDLLINKTTLEFFGVRDGIASFLSRQFKINAQKHLKK